MAKTNEELNELKKRVEDLNKDLAELTEDELSVVFGGQADGMAFPWPTPNSNDSTIYEFCKEMKKCIYASKEECPIYRENLVCKYTEFVVH